MSDTTDSGPSGESITPEGLDELRAEVEGLEGPARRRWRREIKVARELGDLKENADYHIAKEDQAHLETRIKRLRMRLRDAVVVEADEASGDASRSAGPPRSGRWRVGPDAHLDAGRPDRGRHGGRAALGGVAGRPGAARQPGRRGRRVVETPGGEKTYRVERLVG